MKDENIITFDEPKTCPFTGKKYDAVTTRKVKCDCECHDPDTLMMHTEPCCDENGMTVVEERRYVEEDIPKIIEIGCCIDGCPYIKKYNSNDECGFNPGILINRYKPFGGNPRKDIGFSCPLETGGITIKQKNTDK